MIWLLLIAAPAFSLQREPEPPPPPSAAGPTGPVGAPGGAPTLMCVSAIARTPDADGTGGVCAYPTGEVAEVEGSRLRVHRLEAVNGTPILDLKPVLSADVGER